jgi:hypothetical protein
VFVALGLSSAACLFAAVFALVRILPRVVRTNAGVAAATGAAALFLLGGAFALLYRGERVFLGGFQRLALRTAMPAALALGRVFGLSADGVRRSFVELNNRLLPRGRVGRADTLLLLPRCLQRSDCPSRIETDPDLCRRCGRCDITPLLEAAARHGIRARIVTGGTLARRVLGEERARAVVAVACERDLVAGILDALPLPVYGVPNMRPNGPCLDTKVVVSRVEDGILRMLAREGA